MKQICKLLIVVSFLLNVVSAVVAQTVSVSPASKESPAVGEQFTVDLEITNGRNVAGYQVTVTFDTSALRYVESANGNYLPAGAFFVTPNVSGNQVPLSAVALAGESSGDGTLATVTFEVVAVKASTLTLSDVVLSDSAGGGSKPRVENGQITKPSQGVNIPDANLRAAIASTLGKASGAPITVDEMATLTGLNAQNANISDLTGLEHAINLQELYLTDNNISDISALSGLTNLRKLHLTDNSIVDISALSGLTNLTDLWLANNSIVDISALSGLTNLKTLLLYKNSISDISALSGLTNLYTLWSSDNNISDLSPLVSNTGLGQGDQVRVFRNPLNAAAINTHIPTLQGRGVEVQFDAPAPAQTVNIPDANLRAAIEKRLGKASGATITAEEMATLTWLSAEDANISNLTGLDSATNLTVLWLARNSISDISALSNLTNLTRLGIRDNSISDISAIAGLTNLTVLLLDGNSISGYLSGVEINQSDKTES